MASRSSSVLNRWYCPPPPPPPPPTPSKEGKEKRADVAGPGVDEEIDIAVLEEDDDEDDADDEDDDEEDDDDDEEEAKYDERELDDVEVGMFPKGEGLAPLCRSSTLFIVSLFFDDVRLRACDVFDFITAADC